MSLEYWGSELVRSQYLGQLQLVVQAVLSQLWLVTADAVLHEGFGFFPADLLKVPTLVSLQHRRRGPLLVSHEHSSCL